MRGGVPAGVGVGGELAPGAPPTSGSVVGMPLGRTRKTGPGAAALADGVGSGTGDAVAGPVARGVGGMISAGPKPGGGGIGSCVAEAAGEGAGELGGASGGV